MLIYIKLEIGESSGLPLAGDELVCRVVPVPSIRISSHTSRWVDGPGVSRGKIWHSRSCSKYHLATHPYGQAKPWIEYLHNIIKYLHKVRGLISRHDLWPLSSYLTIRKQALSRHPWSKIKIQRGKLRRESRCVFTRCKVTMEQKVKWSPRREKKTRILFTI